MDIYIYIYIYYSHGKLLIVEVGVWRDVEIVGVGDVLRGIFGRALVRGDVDPHCTVWQQKLAVSEIRHARHQDLPSSPHRAHCAGARGTSGLRSHPQGPGHGLRQTMFLHPGHRKFDDQNRHRASLHRISPHRRKMALHPYKLKCECG